MDLIFIFSGTGFVSVIIILVAGVLLLFYSGQRRQISIPPGPKGYPFIGNILDISPSKILKTFRKFRSEYGDLFSIHLGTNLAVVVNGYGNLKEFFSKKGDAVSDRPPIFLFQVLFKGMGLTSSSGHPWKVHRSFVLKVLRTSGLGKKTIESNIMEEVSVCLKEIEQRHGKPFDIHELVTVCVSNIMCSFAFGHRFDHKDEKFKTLLFLMEDILKYSGVSGAISIFPFLKYLPGDPFAGKRLAQDAELLWNFIHNIISEHKMSFDPENLKDFIDIYLQEQTQRIESEKNIFTDEQLKATVTDLLIGGTETTTTSLRWFVLYLLNYPNVQTKMAAEIDAVVGVSRLPSLNDRPNLPYCEAVITEVMRCANLAPLSVMHCASENVHMNGYMIPKGTFLIQNLDSVMMDPILFPYPEEFRPERFIDKNGKFGNYEKVIPFSIGRRMCLGESLAKAELFLFSVSMVQRFRLLPVQENAVPPPKGNLGITYTPNAYELIAIKRH